MEQRILDRFWSKVDKSGDCWIWTAAKFGNGYGMFSPDYRGKSWLAHRFAYEMKVGPIPEGLTIDHLCRKHACVNPAHLEPVTKRENTLRGISPVAVNAQRTHCPHGHAYSPENTWVDKTGARHCRICMKANSARNMPKYKDEYNRRRRESRVRRPRKSTKGIPHGPMSEETKRKLSESRKALFARRRAAEEQQPQ